MRQRSGRRVLTILLGLVLATLVGATAVQAQVLAQEGGGERLQGTLASGTGADREPIPGVTIIVRTADGQEIDTVVSDDEGKWSVDLDGPGTYEVEIDESTLPDGIVLREGANNPLTDVPVNPGAARNVLFPFGEGTSRTSKLEQLLPVTISGLRFGLIIAITAIGLSLIFGTTGLVNFAHGELVTFGAVLTWFYNTTGDGVSWGAAALVALFLAPVGLLVGDRIGPRASAHGTATNTAVGLAWLVGGWAAFTVLLAVLPADLHLVFAAVLGIALTAVMGAALDRGLWRPLRARRTGLITMLVVSIGLSIVLRNILQAWFGGGSAPYTDYTTQAPIDLGLFSITPKEIVITIIALVALLAVAAMLQTTRVGKAMRAVADNRDLAESSGIDVQRIILTVWILGGGLAGLGGVLSAVDENVSFLLGFRLLLLMFAGVILGGLGTAYGALVGSVVVGLVTEWSTLFFSAELKVTWGLAVLIVILLVRPQGLLGTKERFG